MALKTSTDMKNLIVNTIAKNLAGTLGTGGSAIIRFYNGAQPASADDGTSGTCLGTIGGAAGIGLSWGGSNGTIGSTSGTVSFGTSVGYTGTAGTTGTAIWARLETFGTNIHGSAGTFRIDGDVGTASTSTFIVNSPAFTADGAISILSMNLSIG